MTCESCHSVHHMTCVHLTRAQARVITHWRCAACRGRDTADAEESEVINLEEYISRCSQVPSVRIIPRGALICGADALQKLLDSAIREQSLLSWAKLLSFGRVGLGQPAQTPEGGRPSVSLTTQIKRQIQSFMNSDGLTMPEVDSRRSVTTDSDHRLRKAVSARFADCDMRGAVRLLTSTEGLAPRDDNTAALLQRKHPPSPEDLSLPAPPDDDFPAPTVATEESVRRALASFRPGSAGGPDGLRPGHLVALTSGKAGEAGLRLLGSLTKFVNLILEGDVPEFVVPLFYGASVSALNKKGGGIRPIAVGSTLRRLAVKVGAEPMSDAIGEHLRPAQLGFSTRGGCEAAAHAARRYLGEASHRRVLFKVDMANAFNCLRRDVFLGAARERAQGLYRLLWQAYSGPTKLFYGDTDLVSRTGIQQGDPFGPALFSLGIDTLVREIDSEFNVWYLDDGTIGDTPEKVLSCVQRLVENLREVGLEVNQSKCELLILDHAKEQVRETERLFREVLPSLKVIVPTSSTLLGAPLSERGISYVIRERAEDLERMVSKLHLIENHQAFVLLKNCFALPKLQYVLRSSPAYRQEAELGNFDKVLLAALSCVTNTRFEDDARKQAVLPVRLGGLGVRLSSDIALPAFVSSLHSTCGLVDIILQKVRVVGDGGLRVAVGEWRNRNAGVTLPDDADLGRQRTWDEPQSLSAADGLLDRADQTSRARLLAGRCRESGLWLHALPSPALGTLLDSETFRVAVALRVGAAVCEPHVCRCGRRMDAGGLHGLSCKYSAGRLPRHAALNDVVRRALQSAGVPSMLEPVGVDRGDGKRPDGITVFPYSNGRCLCWDATCVDTYAESHVNDSAVSAGSAAKKAEENKRQKYAALAARFRFEPVAVETAGTFGSSTSEFISGVGRRITEVSGDRRETFWLEQRIGLAIQRGNAFSILASVKDKFDVEGPSLQCR